MRGAVRVAEARAPLDRLAADPSKPGDQRGGAARRDQPARSATRSPTPNPARVPRDLHLHRLAPQRALELGHPAAQLVNLGPVRSALQAFRAGARELIAPLPEQAVGDLVLTGELSDRLQA